MKNEQCLRTWVKDPFCLQYLKREDYPDSHYENKLVRSMDRSGAPTSFSKTIYGKLRLCLNCVQFLAAKVREEAIPLRYHAKSFDSRVSFGGFRWKEHQRKNDEFKILFMNFTGYEAILKKLRSKTKPEEIDFQDFYADGNFFEPMLINEDLLLPKERAMLSPVEANIMQNIFDSREGALVKEALRKMHFKGTTKDWCIKIIDNDGVLQK